MSQIQSMCGVDRFLFCRQTNFPGKTSYYLFEILKASTEWQPFENIIIAMLLNRKNP